MNYLHPKNIEEPMKTLVKRTPEIIHASMIAPCGMNCSLCIAFLRVNNPCPGCNFESANKSKSCTGCLIKNCGELEKSETKFCFECNTYPCALIKHIDKRYRTNHGMSMIANLEFIKEEGIQAFVAQEKERWQCPECGGIFSVHKKNCIYCQHPRSYNPPVGKIPKG